MTKFRWASRYIQTLVFLGAYTYPPLAQCICSLFALLVSKHLQTCVPSLVRLFWFELSWWNALCFFTC